jgi:hypothetical protein
MLGGSYTNEDILAFIGTKLTPQEAALLNKTITKANADRMATVNKIFSDNVFTMAEVYEAWESSGQIDIDFEVWAGQQGFILQEDGSYKAAGERAYEAMRTYVKERFGEAYLRMLPT